ncbi:3-dehydroquinate synthase [Haloimpatiens sp. FM7315]|uniref:3-dehydroquinate synthase n=1 Tax=Haloimpatiens sp. FM7315 TaxID=3298609 RepID=UPI00370BF22F
MRKLSIDLPGKNYEIFIQKGLFEQIGLNIRNIYKGKKIAVVTDDKVYRIYGDRMKKNLIDSGYLVKFIIIKNGEKSKNINVLQDIYSGFLDFNLTRKDIILTFGGGVVGDLGGFAAATFLRGIPFIQIPTTLLSQIDSSIGGKVGIDLERGKNLIGSFYHPKAVFVDPEVLMSLEKRVFNDGLSECIKYGCIKSKELFLKLENYKSDKELYEDIDYVIYKCCTIKKEFVEEDEKDTGKRMILNFGHTIGHAIETYFNYSKYTHGEAVAIGMYLITKNSERNKETEKGTSDKIKNLLIKYNLPYTFEKIDTNKIVQTISLDKKCIENSINIILIRNIGESYIKKIKKDQVFNYITDN